jgi:hypothetical protein
MTSNEMQQLVLLRSLLNKTGMLHSGLADQMKYYPLILTHCIKCEIQFSFEDKIVIYKLLEFKGNPPKDIEHRFNLLSNWVKTLIGEEYSVTVEGYDPQKVKNGRNRVKKQAPSAKHRVKRNRK